MKIIETLKNVFNDNLLLILKGKLQQYYFSPFFLARDLLYLGKQSFNTGYYAHAIQWLEEALSQAHREKNSTATPAEIMAFHASAVDMVSDI